MPGVNVDQCTRYCEAAMCGNVQPYAERIHAIPDAYRVRIFRNKTQAQITEILYRLSGEIKKIVFSKFYSCNDGYTFQDVCLTQTGNNNREGADLIHRHKLTGEEINIEVKFGEKTDRNIGMKMFNKIFGNTIFLDALSMSIRKEWKERYYRERDEEAQLRRLWAAINVAIENFNEFERSYDFILQPENQKLMEQEILNNAGDGHINGKFVKIILDGDSFNDLKSIPTGIGKWIVQEVKKIDGTEIKRCNVFVHNYDTNVKIKFVLNWKNDYRIGEIKAPAKLGLGSSNWNVWVEVHVSHIV